MIFSARVSSSPGENLIPACRLPVARRRSQRRVGKQATDNLDIMFLSRRGVGLVLLKICCKTEA